MELISKPVRNDGLFFGEHHGPAIAIVIVGF